MVPEVEALGYAVLPAGSDAGLTPVRRPLARVDPERERRAVGPGFGLRIARERAIDLLRVCSAWQPDLLVCEELDFGAMVVAERLALVWATVPVTAAGSFVRADCVAKPLDLVRAEHGLPPDPCLAAIRRYLVLSPFPPSYRDPAVPVPDTLHPFRAHGGVSDDAALPWASRPTDRPTVYFTLGTVWNVESGDL
jgi:hypothetical protein